MASTPPRFIYAAGTMRTPTLIVAVPLALCACPKQVPLPRGPATPQAYKVLSAVPEAETQARAEKRPDVSVHSDQLDHVPSVVARGEAGPLSLHGGRAQLFGDEAGTRGFGVDNFVLFEVVDASGKVRHRFAVGYHPGTEVEGQEVDNVGRAAFDFDPGLDLTDQLPPDAPFTLRATALDYGGVGRVSDVYLRVTARPERTPTDDELRDH